MLDTLVLVSLRTFVFLLDLLPLKVRLFVAELIIRFASFVLPRYRKIALRNLELAFPESDLAWRKQVVERTYASMARLFIDFARLKHLDTEWVKSHIEFIGLQRLAEVQKVHPEKNIMLASGHLGSFELLAHALAVLGHPLSFVVRDFKLPKLNAWWRSMRELNGNKAISRKGAFKSILRHLRDGNVVGILFDQNLTRENAVFVDWFGIPAATTKAFAYAAIRTEAFVFVISISYLGNERYRAELVECDFSKIYRDESVDIEEKVRQITASFSKVYEEMVRKSPHEWFWIHRRWKTRPEGEEGKLY